MTDLSALSDLAMIAATAPLAADDMTTDELFE